MKNLSVIVLPGEWELWFLDSERVFSDHRMDWLDLLDFVSEWGVFSWSYVCIEGILAEGRRNVFSLRSGDMPKSWRELKNMLLVSEYEEMLNALQNNRRMPKESTP